MAGFAVLLVYTLFSLVSFSGWTVGKIIITILQIGNPELYSELHHCTAI